MRVYNPLDAWIVAADNALRTVHAQPHSARRVPGLPTEPEALSADERKLSGALMRVNHVGEVCAQALYEAQALTARSDSVRDQMRAASREETDHLAWTAQRLKELGDRPSLLNPLWYAGAFTIGVVAGKAGDAWSLGFMVETERQVEQHLASHLDRLPAADQTSRAIVAQMKVDEAHHAEQAEAAGAAAMPQVLRSVMKGAASIMTRIAHHL